MECRDGDWCAILGDVPIDTPSISSRMKLLTDRPPQLMPPPIRLPARLSRRFLLGSRFGLLIMEMGLGPALTKESWRLRPMADSKEWPVVMSMS